MKKNFEYIGLLTDLQQGMIYQSLLERSSKYDYLCQDTIKLNIKISQKDFMKINQLLGAAFQY